MDKVADGEMRVLAQFDALHPPEKSEESVLSALKVKHEDVVIDDCFFGRKNIGLICPLCDSHSVTFREVVTRSADEGSSILYSCDRFKCPYSRLRRQ